jgi:two-component sensor histidine kinase
LANLFRCRRPIAWRAVPDEGAPLRDVRYQRKLYKRAALRQKNLNQIDLLFGFPPFWPRNSCNIIGFSAAFTLDSPKRTKVVFDDLWPFERGDFLPSKYHWRDQLVLTIVEKDRSTIESLIWIVCLLVVPIALRDSVDRGALGLPFISFWPRLVIASIALRLRFAILFAMLAAVISQRLFGGGAWFRDVSTARIIFFGLFALSAGLILTTGTMLRRSLRMLTALNLQREMYNRELRHRVRNMLTLIKALASRGPKAASAIDFYKEFSLRIEGLAAASDLLQIGAEAEGRLPQLIRQTLAPFDNEGRIRLVGEPCLLPAGSCIPLIMVLHELCTNAVKHGALLAEHGRVDVSWFIGPDQSTLYILWAEKNGPLVKKPSHEGLGTRLLMPQPGIEGVDLNFDPAGLWCEFRIEGAKGLPA